MARKPFKPKTPNRAEQLARDWEAMMAKHAKPLERGAIAKGVTSVPSAEVKLPVVTEPLIRETPVKPSRSMFLHANATTPHPNNDPRLLLDATAHIGQLYNKGGLQVLTPGDVAEQKSGSHRRRS